MRVVTTTVRSLGHRFRAGDTVRKVGRWEVCDPYFATHIVVASNWRQGLFVLRPKEGEGDRDGERESDGS